MNDSPEATQGEIPPVATTPEIDAAKTLLAGANWSSRNSSKGVIPVLSSESSLETVDKVEAALKTLDIPYERFTPGIDWGFETQLRVKSTGRDDFVAALRDSAATVRSPGSEMFLRVESAVKNREASPARGR